MAPVSRYGGMQIENDNQTPKWEQHFIMTTNDHSMQKIILEVWDPTQGNPGSLGLFIPQFVVVFWEFKFWYLSATLIHGHFFWMCDS